MTAQHPLITADTVFGDIDLDETPITLPSGRVLAEKAAAEDGA